MIGRGIPAVIGPTAMLRASGDSGVEEVYFVAGFSTMSQAVITKVTIPQDLCELIIDEEKCLATLGCAACSRNGSRTYCYSNDQPRRIE